MTALGLMLNIPYLGSCLAFELFFFQSDLDIQGVVIVLQITRKLCEEELLKIKGVISFTFVMSKSRCIIRCKVELAPETLCDAINNTKVLSAQQVVKNERGEEVGRVLDISHRPQISVYTLQV